MHKTNVAIIGGGVAGLWLLNRVTASGHSALLIEKDALGSGQSLASQGMIHGGVKYMLAGAATGASETIAEMPGRWQSCLDGQGEIDLSHVQLLSDAYYLFSDGRLSSKVTAFFGSKAVKGRVSLLEKTDYPDAFRNDRFRGLLYRLQDVVLDTGSLIHALAADNEKRIVRGEPVLHHHQGEIDCIELSSGVKIKADTYVLAAGAGNGVLIETLGLPVTMQLRPLHQVIIKSESLPPLYAHAVSLKTADKPRMTITTHPLAKGCTWYLGGDLAESGINRDPDAQIEQSRKELSRLLPWIPLNQASFSTLRINRAEAGTAEKLRPDTPYVKRIGNVVICWPTKLTLAPLMGDLFMETLMETNPGPVDDSLDIPTSPLGVAPWE